MRALLSATETLMMAFEAVAWKTVEACNRQPVVATSCHREMEAAAFGSGLQDTGADKMIRSVYHKLGAGTVTLMSADPGGGMTIDSDCCKATAYVCGSCKQVAYSSV
jgi:hypothetical protein